MIQGLARIIQKKQSMDWKGKVCKLSKPYQFPLFIWHICKITIVKTQR